MQGYQKFSSLAALPAALALALAQPALAADEATPRATEYMQVTGLPDWTGIWYPDWGALFKGRAAAKPKLTPAAQARYDAYLAKIKADGPDQYDQIHCIPPGMPGVMQEPFPIEILYSPGRVTIFTEAYSQVRRIYTDGRPLPADPDPFFNGNSVGHWEGDTLVIASTGFSLETHLVPGLDHSDKMRVDERIWLDKPGQLFDEMSITDPETLTEPFVIRVAYKLDNAFPLREYVCAENNHLITGENGGANIELDLGDDDDPFGQPLDEGETAGQ